MSESRVRELLRPNRDQAARAEAAAAIAAIAAGGLARLLGAADAGDALWGVCAAVILVPLTWDVIGTLRRGRVGVDMIALIAIAAALALGEYLAAAVVALMLSGGNALEAYASRRARRELTRLLERAPRTAHRHRAGGFEEVAVDDLQAGDIVLVRTGELVPVDGVVTTAYALLDESTLTGEPLPVGHRGGTLVKSGTANAGDPFELRAARPASESAYAALVRLVRSAETQRAPFVRMADRYAALLLPVTLALAGLAWGLAGDPVRALAVLVVATPCPLILAAPIALISGVSRAARSGIIVKGGSAVEKLGEARTVLLDKTGTLTLGSPAVEQVIALDGLPGDEILRLAASLDQLSAHVLAEALVHEARERKLQLEPPRDVREEPGRGIAGVVADRRIAVGSPRWLGAGFDEELPGPDGSARVAVAVNGRPAGVIVMADRLRSDAGRLVSLLHDVGIGRVAMVTGDSERVARAVAADAGIDRVYADQAPEDKLEVVRAMREQPKLRPVVMVGDGVNDAPALALADVGVALASGDATVSSDTADVVITTSRVDRVADAIRIGRRSLAIARQSVVVGIGLSAVAMVFAALGFIAPVAGALLQELIDVVVIANALRALRA